MTRQEGPRSRREGMRILVVNWLDPRSPRAGGAELHLLEVFSRLVRRGHEVALVSSGWDGAEPEEWVEGIRVIRVGRPWSFAFVWRRGVARAGGFVGYDLVVEDLNKVPLGIGRSAPIPTVVMVHHLWGAAAFRAASLPVGMLTWLAELGVDRMYRGQKVIAVSDSCGHELSRRGIPTEAISVIENGVVVPDAPPAEERDRTTLPTFAYVGRLQRYKRLHLVIAALATLRREGKDVRLIIAGTGPEEGALMRQSSRLGLSEAVEFRGYIGDEERHRLFRECWAHVQPSSREGWGLTVMEAAAAGTCTIAANSAGLCDSVVHGLTGLLVPKRLLPTFADALRFIADNPGEAWEMGAAAYRRAQSYTWERAADGVEQVLEMVRMGVSTDPIDR